MCMNFEIGKSRYMTNFELGIYFEREEMGTTLGALDRPGGQMYTCGRNIILIKSIKYKYRKH